MIVSKTYFDRDVSQVPRFQALSEVLSTEFVIQKEWRLLYPFQAEIQEFRGRECKGIQRRTEIRHE